MTSQPIDFARALLIAVLLTGCSSPPQPVEPMPDGGTSRWRGKCDPAALPAAPPDSCFIGQECGNELAVGRACSKGGGQCPALEITFTLASFCGADFSDDAIGFCTRPCTTPDSCGSDAVCLVDPKNPGRKGCAPAKCGMPAEVEGPAPATAPPPG